MKKQTCKNCQHSFTGNFCNICGEKVLKREDLTIRKVLSDLFSALTFAESKFWRTLKLILFRPGTLSRHYMDGIRVNYMKPISIFFLANLLYFLYPIFNTFNTSLHLQTTAFRNLYSETVASMVEKRLEKDHISQSEYTERLADFEIRYNAKTTELSKLLLIVMVLLCGFWLWLIHAFDGHRIVSHFIISFEIMTFLILICLQLLGLLSWLLSSFFYLSYNDLIVSILILTILFPFLWRVEQNFFKNTKLRSALNALAINAGLVVSLYFYRAFLFFATFYTV